MHEAEAMWLLEATNWINQLGFHNIILELECKHVVDCYNSASSNTTEFDLILKKCKRILSNINNHMICLTKRQANYVTHTLARMPELFDERNYITFLHEKKGYF